RLEKSRFFKSISEIREMKKITVATLLMLLFLAKGTEAQHDTKMDAFIDNLMRQMTLSEKIGQLNLVTSGEATTGSTVSSDVESKIKQGQVGGIFSMSTPAKIRRTQ